MLAYETPEIVNLIVAAGIAYVLGALPIAERVSRRRGIDIFNIGTGLAGSTNVLKNVGRVSGAVVFLGDMAKGIVAVFVAQQLLGIEGPWVVVPTASAIIGQWNSVFSGFKGGDGLVVLGGATLAVFPEYGIIGVAFAALVALVAQKMPYSSLINILAGYMIIILLAQRYFSDDLDTALAMGGLALLVFGHAVFGHARRRRSEVELAGGDLADNRETG
jgi:glycerol-3-phosphate acyltransferase PlsY